MARHFGGNRKKSKKTNGPVHARLCVFTKTWMAGVGGGWAGVAGGGVSESLAGIRGGRVERGAVRCGCRPLSLSLCPPPILSFLSPAPRTNTTTPPLSRPGSAPPIQHNPCAPPPPPHGHRRRPCGRSRTVRTEKIKGRESEWGGGSCVCLDTCVWRARPRSRPGHASLERKRQAGACWSAAWWDGGGEEESERAKKGRAEERVSERALRARSLLNPAWPVGGWVGGGGDFFLHPLHTLLPGAVGWVGGPAGLRACGRPRPVPLTHDN